MKYDLLVFTSFSSVHITDSERKKATRLRETQLSFERRSQSSAKAFFCIYLKNLLPSI